MGIHVDIKLDGEVAEYVTAMTDGSGWYANVEEYVRDLIRKDVQRDRAEYQSFRAELQAAFAAPEEDAIKVTADEFLAQIKSQAA